MTVKKNRSKVKKSFFNETLDRCKLIIIPFLAEIDKHDRNS